MTEHTAIPWKCGITNAGRHRVSVLIQTPDGNMILKATGLPKRGVMLANAHFIVTACNSHANLLKALTACLLKLEQNNLEHCNAGFLAEEEIRKAEEQAD